MLRKCVPNSFLPCKQWTWMLQPWQRLLRCLSRISPSVFFHFFCLFPSSFLSVCPSVCLSVSGMSQFPYSKTWMLQPQQCLLLPSVLYLSVWLSLCLCLSVLHLADGSLAEIMAAEELVPDILAIVAARLKEQVQILARIQCTPDLSLDWSLDISLDLNLTLWPISTLISTEGAEADRPGGTGENNRIKQLPPDLENYSLVISHVYCSPFWQWLLSYISL